MAASAAVMMAVTGVAHAQGNAFIAATLLPASTTSGPYFDFPSVLNANGYTVEAWVKLGAANSGIVQLGTPAALGLNSIFLSTTYDSGTLLHTLRFTGVTDEATYIGTFSGGTFAADTWTHVAATFDLVSNTPTAKLYVNAVLGSSQDWSDTSGIGPNYEDNTFGQIVNGSTTTTTNGSISGLRVWSTRRTDLQLNTYKNITNPLVGQSSLVYNYVMGSTGYGPLTQGLNGATGNELVLNGATGSNVIYTKWGNDTLSLQSGTSFGNATLKVEEGLLTYGGTFAPLGDVIVQSGSVFAGSINIASGKSLSGSGYVAGTVSGAGSVDPGDSPGIFESTALDPTANGSTRFDFEFTASDPDYNNPSNSLNDVYKLTGATPFASALTSSNLVNLYFSSITGTPDFRGGFFTTNQQDFLSSISAATFNYWVQDAGGTEIYNGNTYRNANLEYQWSLSTVPVTDGQVLEIVPEPSSVALAGLGVAGLACGVGFVRRRRVAAAGTRERKAAR